MISEIIKFKYPSFTTTIDTTKKCFKMFDGAAKFTIMKMSTPDIKELVEILTKEVKFREEIEDARTQTLDYSGRGESPNHK